MTLRRRKIFLLAVCLGCSWLALATQAAIPTNGIPRGAATNFSRLPIMPTLRSPVDAFRELLAMPPAERRQSLSNRPVEVQKQILVKLREYQSLKPEEQELRLRATELQWYLLPLMSMPPAARESRLSLIPEEQRKLVKDRLNRWDGLPASVREEMLNNEMTARYFAQINSTGRTNVPVTPGLSPERRAKLEAGIDRWRGLSEEQREKTLAGFNAFFELTPQEKQRALSTVSEAEQKQMEKTLQTYEKLSPAQRLQCIRSFEKFAGMSLADRQAFLKNAERWKLMSPTERAAWRKLVTYAPLLPPMPVRPAQRPPMPLTPARAASESVATNNN
jgi:hypothetical protein